MVQLEQRQSSHASERRSCSSLPTMARATQRSPTSLRLRAPCHALQIKLCQLQPGAAPWLGLAPRRGVAVGAAPGRDRGLSGVWACHVPARLAVSTGRQPRDCARMQMDAFEYVQGRLDTFRNFGIITIFPDDFVDFCNQSISLSCCFILCWKIPPYKRFPKYLPRYNKTIIILL